MKFTTFCRVPGLYALPALIPLLAGCGGGGSPGTSAHSSTVTLTADQTDVLRGQALRLEWSAPNGVGVDASNFGAQAVSGSLVVFPAETTTYSLTVHTASGETASQSVKVRVASVSVKAAPATATVDVSQSVTFTAQVSGAFDKSVLWSVQEAGGGSVTNNGVYTAPTIAGTYHVQATSASDISKFAVILVQARAASGTVTVN